MRNKKKNDNPEHGTRKSRSSVVSFSFEKRLDMSHITKTYLIIKFFYRTLKNSSEKIKNNQK